MPKNKIIRAEPQKFYTVREIFNAGLFPWISSYQTAYRFVTSRLDVFSPVVVQHSTRKTYRIKGLEINRFLDSL